MLAILHMTCSLETNSTDLLASFREKNLLINVSKIHYILNFWKCAWIITGAFVHLRCILTVCLLERITPKCYVYKNLPVLYVFCLF